MNARKTLLAMAAAVVISLVLFPSVSNVTGSSVLSPLVDIRVYDATQTANPNGPDLPNVQHVCATIEAVVAAAGAEDVIDSVEQALLDKYDDVLILLTVDPIYVIKVDPETGETIVVCYGTRSFQVDFPTGTVTADVEVGTFVSN